MKKRTLDALNDKIKQEDTNMFFGNNCGNNNGCGIDICTLLLLMTCCGGCKNDGCGSGCGIDICTLLLLMTCCGNGCGNGCCT